MWERLCNFFPTLVLMVAILIMVMIIGFVASQHYGEKCKNAKQFHKNCFKLYWLTDGTESCITAPVFEEMMFRLPVIILCTQLTVGAWIAVVISSLLFGAAHWGNFSKEKVIHRFALLTVPTILGAGIAVCGILLQTVWLGVAIHSFWNFSCCVSHYVIMKKQLDETMSTPEGEAILQETLTPSAKPLDPQLPLFSKSYKPIN